MNRISPNIQTLQISLRTFFVIVTIAAVLCMIAGKWESISCRIKYGNPTDLSSVAIVGINDDAYILEIDGNAPLRPLVIMRKICFGNRSLEGGKRLAAIMSVKDTARRHGHNPLHVFYWLFTQPPDKVMRSLYKKTPATTSSA